MVSTAVRPARLAPARVRASRPACPCGAVLRRAHNPDDASAHRSPSLLPSSGWTRHAWMQRGRNRRDHVATRALFDSVSMGMEKAWSMVAGEEKLTEQNIKAPLREIRRTLLQADVSLNVCRGFVSKVQQRALGEQVTKGVRPDQQLVKVVHNELVSLLGSEMAGLQKPRVGPRIILLAGLQGVGKTTACGKLARYLKEQGEKVLVVSADVYRPAAIDQLQMLADKVDVDFMRLQDSEAPVNIARAAVQRACKEKYDALLVDTAGRLQVDDGMMEELKQLKSVTGASDTLLVVDAMTGQEAAMLAKTFNDAVNISGAVLTKLDGDSRGGAALSVRAVSGKPIKFVGTGEKMDALEPFYPERLASRVLGMGDVLTLVEKAEKAVSEKDAGRLMQRMMSSKFDFNDFLSQYKMISSMGSMSSFVKMIPGMNKIDDKDLRDVEKKYDVFESIIEVMADEEKSNPDLLAKQASRRRRLVRDSGCTASQVDELLATFTRMRVGLKGMSKMMASMGGAGMMNDDEMLTEVADNVGAKNVPPGLVRRKRRKPTTKQPVFAATAKGFGAV